jgi:hypothetical protein
LKQFQEVEGAIVIRILKRDPNKSFIHMANERYIIPNATRVLIDFSEDGKIFAIFIEKEDKSCQLKIVSLFEEDENNILRFIEILNNEEKYLNEEI